jgi:hypothetical protein
MCLHNGVLLHVYPHTTIYVLITICDLINICVLMYYYMCVFVLQDASSLHALLACYCMCPHSTIFSYRRTLPLG